MLLYTLALFRRGNTSYPKTVPDTARPASFLYSDDATGHEAFRGGWFLQGLDLHCDGHRHVRVSLDFFPRMVSAKKVKILSFKTALLIVLASAKLVGKIHAPSV